VGVVKPVEKINFWFHFSTIFNPDVTQMLGDGYKIATCTDLEI